MNGVGFAKCDNCAYVNRHIDDTALFTRAKGHPKRKKHRVVVKFENQKEDVVYDYRPPESGTDNVK